MALFNKEDNLLALIELLILVDKSDIGLIW